MFHAKLRNHRTQHLISAGKIQSIHSFEGNKKCGPLIHPFPADFTFTTDLQSMKQSLAVFSNIKKCCQHAHSQCFSKTSRPGNQCHLSRACTQEFPDQTRFINIIISILPDLRKIRNTYRNFQFRHLISPFHRQS